MVLLKKLAMYASTCLLLLLCLSRWFWLSYSTPITLTNPQKSIFHDTSLVDFHNGSMDGLVTWLQTHPITLVIFYTPWSGQCMKVTTEIVEAHLRLDNPYVSMIGINCWVGQCRQSFQSLSFPRLFLYHTNHAPIEYLDDVIANNIIRFIQSSIRPFQYIGGNNELEKFLETYDSNVITYMDAKELEQENKIFDVFVATSVHLVNRVNVPRIGVVLCKELARSLGLHTHGNLLLNSHFFSSKYYSKFANYTKDDIVHWIVISSKQVINLLTPNSTDNIFYVNELREPALIMAIPFSGLHDNQRLLQNYRHAVLSYYNCDCSEASLNFRKQQQQQRRRGKIEHTTPIIHHTECPGYVTLSGHTFANCKSSWSNRSYTQVAYIVDNGKCCTLVKGRTGINYKGCSTLRTNCNRDYSYLHSLCSFRGVVTGNAVLQKTEKNLRIEDSVKQLLDESVKIDENLSTMLNDDISRLIDGLGHFGYNGSAKAHQKLLTFFSTDGEREPTGDRTSKSKTQLPFADDVFNVHHHNPGLKIFTKRLKRRLDSDKSYRVPYVCGTNAPCCTGNIQSRLQANLTVSHFKGLACQTNRTLKFYLLNNSKYKYLLENAGIVTRKPSLLLVDVVARSHYRLMETLDYFSIVKFILRFTAGELVREYISTQNSMHNSLHEGVVELTTNTFYDEIYGNNMHVLVMFYASWCGVCKPAHLVLLRLIKKATKYMIKIARIDGDRHELPWQYAPSSYPSFVLFPSKRKDASIAYPDDLEITVDGLQKFFDTHLR